MANETLIGKLEVIDLALDKSIDVNDEYMDEAKSLLTKLIKEVQQREIPVVDEGDDLTPAVIANYRKLIKESIAPDGKYGFFAAMADTLLDWIEKYGRKPKREAVEEKCERCGKLKPLRNTGEDSCVCGECVIEMEKL